MPLTFTRPMTPIKVLNSPFNDNANLSHVATNAHEGARQRLANANIFG